MIYSEFIRLAALHLRTSPIEVERTILTAPYRYKHYKISKRRGGERDIHHPTPALKAIQRWMVGGVLHNLPVHDAVCSYRRGISIADHAAIHVRSNFFVRFDFSDFFPSITHSVLRQHLLGSAQKGLLDVDPRTIDAIVRLACRASSDSRRLVLSIGAPSSPFISNSVLFDFDSSVAAAMRRSNCVYTRYADDVYISAPSKQLIEEANRFFRSAVQSSLPFLRINEGKTQHLSRKSRVTVTGLIVTPQRSVSLGRDLKRSIKTRVYLALNSQLPAEDLGWLRGMIAHAKGAEPDFFNALVRKFGESAIGRVMNPL